MRKALAALLSVVLTLLLVASAVAGWLLLTTSGARWLVGLLTDIEPRLAMTVEAGALASGLEVSDVAWRGGAASVSATRAVLEWSPGCLLQPAACIDRLSLDGLRVRIEPGGAEQEPADDEPGGELRLPLPVRVALLQLADAQFSLPGTELRIGSLQASGEFADGTLALDWARIGEVGVVTAQAEESATDTEAQAAEATAGPIELPAIDLPLDLVIRNLVLDSADLIIGERQILLRQLALSAALRGSELEVDRLQLTLEPVDAELAGTITLAGDYPLSMRVRARAALPDLPAPVDVTTQLEGSVAKLAVKADLASPAVLHVEATLQPLDEGLPFDVAMRWAQLAYPLEGEPAVTLQNGELQVTGDLQGYRGTLSTALTGEQVPAGSWRGRFAGNLEELRIGELSGETLEGRIDAHGQLRWADRLTWQVSLEAKEINPGVQWPDYAGRLGGRLEANGRVDDQGLSFTASTPGFGGMLRDYPLDLRGTLRKDGDEAWRFKGVRLASGDNRVEIDGALTDRWTLQGRFRLPSPQALLPDLSGSASGRFTLRGAVAEPDIALDLRAGSLRYQEYAVRGLTLEGDIRRLAFEESRLRWHATGVRQGDRTIGTVSGRLEGDRGDHTLALNIDGPEVGGAVRLAGGLDAQLSWAGKLMEAAIQMPPKQRWTLTDPLALRWDQPQRQLSVDAHCWRQQGARLCLQEPATVGERGEVQVRLSAFRLDWLSPWLPEGIVWQAPLSGEATAAWQPDAPPRVQASLSSEGGEIVLAQEFDEPIELSYQRLGATLAMERGAVAVEATLASRQLGSGRVAIQTEFGPAPRPLGGEVVLSELRLELLRAFLPDVHTLDGTIDVRGTLAGSLQAPRFVGNVRLADGRLAAANLPMELADIQLRADVNGSRADLTGSFASGEGTARLSGIADWGGEGWRLDLGLRGEQLRVIYEPVARLQVSPDLQIRVRPQRVDVQGKVVVPSGDITLRALPEGAVQVSDDVVVINRQQTTDEEGPAQEWIVTTDIELILGDKVAIAGYGLTGRLGGSLRVRQRPGGVPEATGDLRIEDGQYKAYGQELEIRQGQLLFAGPISEPNLSVEAIRRVDNVVAGLRVEGQPDAPEATLFSEPAMPQEEILSYLIRGRPLGGGNGGEQQLLAQAAVSLGVFGGRGLATSLAEELGVEDFELGTAGEGEETQVELSGYITPDLMVRYGIGVFEPVNTLTLRYRINKNFFVEAVSGLESALDFFYEFEF